MPVPRARGWLARLGPVWAVLAISLLASFMPTSVGAQTANEPGRLDIEVGVNTCAPPSSNLDELAEGFPTGKSGAKDVKFFSSNHPRAVAVDLARKRLFIATFSRPGMIDIESDTVLPVAPNDASGAGSDIAVDTASGNVFYGGGNGGNNNPNVMMVASTQLGTKSPQPVPIADATATSLAAANNKVYFAENGRVSLTVPGQSGPPTVVAGGGDADAAVGGPATGAKLDGRGARDLAVAGSSLYILEGGFNGPVPPRVVRIDLGSGRITQIVSSPLERPLGIAVDSRGNLYVSDSNKVLLFDRGGSFLRPVAGDGTNAALTDAHTWARTAPLDRPWGLAVDQADNLFIAVADRCAIARVVKPADAGTTPTTSAPTTSTPTTVASSNTTLPPAPPTGNQAGDPAVVNSPDPSASTGGNLNPSGSPDAGGATGVDPNPAGLPDAGGAAGSDFQIDPDAFGAGAFDLDSFGFGDSFNFDPDAFGAGAFDLDAFGQFDPSLGGTGVDGLDGMAGVGGTDPLNPGAQVLPGAAPTPPAQPVASGPPAAGQGPTAQQVGLGATSGQVPRGAARYSMVARSDDGAPVAAMALATGAIALFTCFLVLAAAPGPSRAHVASRSRPRPRGAY